MDIFVARQPIFDSKKQVVGYELLHRSGLTANTYSAGDGTEASLAVIRSAFLFFGERILPRPRQAFINFTKDLLMSGIARMLPPDCTVIEVLEDVVADDQLVEACRELKKVGYTIALDDYVANDQGRSSLIDLADIVKVNLKEVSEEEAWSISEGFDGEKKLVAEGIETIDQFNSAFAKGFTLFQGYFFSKPIIVPGRDIPTNKLNYVRILEELNKPDLNLHALETIIKHDTALCYTLLRYINSAYFGLREKITSIYQAMLLLGETQVRKWACLVLFTFLGADRPPEVVVRSMIRGRMCELLAPDVNAAAHAPELFLVGMFSLLDVLIGQPLKRIIKDLNLGPIAEGVLLGGESIHAPLFRLVVDYESGDWEGLAESVRQTPIEPDRVLNAYVEAVEWADEMSGLTSSQN
jgi:EAL and modified HD-GYP domain-containing signal transduction protein